MVKILESFTNHKKFTKKMSVVIQKNHQVQEIRKNLFFKRGNLNTACTKIQKLIHRKAITYFVLNIK